MRLSTRFVQSYYWESLVPACWWVELGLATLVGRAVLRKTLSSLSADGESVLLPCFLSGLRHLSTGVSRLLGGTRYCGGNGGLQEGSHQ